MKSTFTVPKRNLPWLREQIKKLNIKANKHRLPELNYSEGEEGFPLTETDSIDGFEISVPTIIVTIDGVAPDVNGWSLAARIQPTDQGNIVNGVPGVDLPDWVRTFNGCQHCNMNRRRNDLFAVAHDVTGIKVVGRTCLKDFFENSNPQAIIDYAKMVADILTTSESAQNKSFYRNDEKYMGFDLFQTLMWAHAESSVFGFVPASRKYDGDVPTRDYVREIISNTIRGEDRVEDLKTVARANKITILDYEARKQVQKVIAWAKSLDPINDYLHNLQVIARNGFVDWRGMGYAASMFRAYERQKVDQERESQKQNSDFIGVVGEKISFIGKIVYMQWFENGYNGSTLIKFVSQEGNVVNWWATNPPELLQKGIEVAVTGKVKKHDTYKDQKNTVITHAKAIERN